MKKLLAFLCIVMLIAALPLSSSAVYYNLIENETIVLPEGAPTIDGTITADEGWSTSGWLDYDTHSGAWGTNPLTGTVEFNFAYTGEGVYIAAVVKEVGAAYMVRYYDADGNTAYDASFMDPNAGSYSSAPGCYPEFTTDGDSIDYYLIDNNTTSAPAGVVPKNCFTYTFSGNSFQVSTGEDDIDGEFGFNGDTIGFCIDLLGSWENDGFLGNTDYLPMYNMGIFADGSVKVARSHYNNADITVECKTAGTLTADGAVMEVMIPWDVIVADHNDYGAIMGLSTEATVEDVTAEGALHRATINWQDRFYDEEAEVVDTWGRFITTCAQTAAGTPGHELDVASFGLKLQMGGAGVNPPAPDSDPVDDDTTLPEGDDTTEPADSDTVVVTDDKGNTVTDDKGNTVTDTKKADDTTKKAATTTKTASTKKPTTSTGSSSAAQTFDAGIAVAIGALATSALGVVYSKKRK